MRDELFFGGKTREKLLKKDFYRAVLEESHFKILFLSTLEGLFEGL